jgi:hypothetical protein
MADKNATAPEAAAAPEPLPVVPEPLPTVRDHIERLALERWQAAAIVARLNGEFINGVRRFPLGVSLITRMSVADFDAALQAMMTGRV